MKGTVAIARKEILSYSVLPSTYILFAILLLVVSFFFFNFLASFQMDLQRYQALPVRDLTRIPNLNQQVIEPLFQTVGLLLVFVVPLLTMRTFAEERRSGTLEYLLTAPVSEAAVVAGKFLALMLAVTLLVSGATVYPLLLCWFGNPEPLLVVTGWIGVMSFGVALVAIGIAASAWSQSQMFAGLAAAMINILLFVIHAPAEHVPEFAQALFFYLSSRIHLTSMLEGVLSTTSSFYFLSLIVLSLFLSVCALRVLRWR